MIELLLLYVGIFASGEATIRGGRSTMVWAESHGATNDGRGETTGNATEGATERPTDQRLVRLT